MSWREGQGNLVEIGSQDGPEKEGRELMGVTSPISWAGTVGFFVGEGSSLHLEPVETSAQPWEPTVPFSWQNRHPAVNFGDGKNKEQACFLPL